MTQMLFFVFFVLDSLVTAVTWLEPTQVRWNVAELDAKVRPKLRPFTGLRDFLATRGELALVLANSTPDFLK